MIVAWNNAGGQIYAFETIEAYKAFATETEGNGRTCWADTVYDIGSGGEATPDKVVDMTEFKCSIG